MKIIWVKKKDSYLTIFIIFIFLLLPFIFFSDTFNIGSIVQGSGDPTTIGLPIYKLRISTIKQMDFPFWDILNYSGYPLYGYIEMNPFYPITLLFGLIFPTVVAFNLSLLFHYSLAGIFMYLLLKELKVNNISSFVGSFVFMFSGTMITHRSHPWQIFTIIWFPLIILLLEKYRKNKRLYLIFIAAIIYAISFLGGSPQLFLYGSIIILSYILFYSFISFKGKKDYLFLSSLTIFIITPLLVSFQLFPTLELMQESVRENISYTFFSDYSFNFKMLPVLVSPFIFGNPFFSKVSLSTYSGSWNYNEMVIYFGLVTMPLMVIGAFVKDKRKWLWIFLMAFSFMLVFGRSIPLYKIMYYIPLYNMFRAPTRNWFEFGFAFSILCSFGLNYLTTKADADKLRKISNILLGVFISLLIGFFSLLAIVNTKFQSVLIEKLKINNEKLINVFSNIHIRNYAIYTPIIFISITIIILFLMRKWWKNKVFLTFFIIMICADLFCFGHFFEGNSEIFKNNNFTTSSNLNFLENNSKEFRIYPVATSAAGKDFAHNKNIYLNSDVITGHIQFLLKDYNYITGIGGSTDNIAGYDELIKNQSIISMLNTKYIILDEKKYKKLTEDNNYNLRNNYKIFKTDDKKIILENPKVLPRFYYISNILLANNIDEVKDILWNDVNFNISNNAIILDENLTNNDFNQINKFNSNNSKISKKTEIPPDIIEYKNNSATLKTNNQNLSFLVFSDSYFPGWKVTINGKTDKIYKVNGILKGIFVPPGENTIIFSYLPTNLMLYIIISCATFTVMLLICIFEKKLKVLLRK